MSTQTKLPFSSVRKAALLTGVALGGLVAFAAVARAQVWQATTAPLAPWAGVAASADFTRLAAVEYSAPDFGPWPGFIYTSADSGATWMQTSAPSAPWQAIVCSADGTKLAAVANGGTIMTSADAGSNWVQTGAPTDQWWRVASSADGAKLVASAVGWPASEGSLYTSQDLGATWQLCDGPSNNVISLASSADGAKLFAATEADALYKSSDSGATWLRCPAQDAGWTSVACSADGSTVAAASANGSLFYSADSGASWSMTLAPTGFGGAFVACSADGGILVAANTDPTNNFTGLYTSTNLGATWILADTPFEAPAVLAMSADGQKLMVAGPADLGAGTNEWFDESLIWISPYAGPWRLARAPLEDWQKALIEEGQALTLSAAATSADGTKLVVVPYYGSIYLSSDSGNTWSTTSSTTNIWYGVVSSTDALTLVALGLDSNAEGLVCVSSDSGATWVTTLLPTNSYPCTAVASSSDCRKLIAASASGGIFASSDSGRSWIQTGAPSRYWTGVASSADGTRLAASAGVYYVARSSDVISVSADSGATWNRTDTPSNWWSSITSSADGFGLAAVGVDTNNNAFIYVSSDAGATWSQASGPGNISLLWQAVAFSADGTTLVAVAVPIQSGLNLNSAFVYVSTNLGVTWTSADAPALNWGIVTSSANASTIVTLGGLDIGILRSPAASARIPPSPVLKIGQSSQGVDLSWLVPSERFVLQQTSDLAGMNWTNILVAPSLNLTNLNYQATLSPSSSNGFYRLRQQ